MKRYYIEYEVEGRKKSVPAEAKSKKEAKRQVEKMYGDSVKVEILSITLT